MNLPNLLTLARMVMVPFLAVVILRGEDAAAFTVFLAAGLTDAADGLMARYFRQQSSLGAILDPLADKLLLTAAFVLLSLPPAPRPFPSFHPLNRIPPELTIVTLSRDLLIVLIAAVLYLLGETTRFPPTLLGKLHTFVQWAAVLGVLGFNALKVRSDLVVPALLWLTLVTTLASGFHYLFQVPGLRGRGAGAAPPGSSS